MPPRFEHIAFAVHEEDFLAWDRLLRGGFGGAEGMGGDAADLGFRGVQIPYPCGGMLEILSWTVPIDPASPIVRYVERYGPRAALHHLTFLVDSIDAARDQCRDLGYQFMQGRENKHWKEIYLRAPFFEPPKMLIQVLEADKEALKKAEGDAVRSDALDRTVAPAAAATRIVGVRMACSDVEAAVALFGSLLGATVRDSVLSWPRSSMTIELVESGAAADSHVVIEPPAGQAPQHHRDAPPAAARLVGFPTAR